MAKQFKAILSDQSRGQIDKGQGIVSILEGGEPPPTLVDNKEFYETWHCVWEASPTSTIKTLSLSLDFKVDYEYMVAAIQPYKDNELGWTHHIITQEVIDKDSVIANSKGVMTGCVDDHIVFDISGKKVFAYDNDSWLVKVLARPIRVINSPSERKYATDWERTVVSASKRPNYSWEYGNQYVGWMHKSGRGSIQWSCDASKDMAFAKGVDVLSGTSSFRWHILVKVRASNRNTPSGTYLDGYEPQLGIIYKRPLDIVTAANANDSNWEQKYWNKSSNGTKSVYLNWQTNTEYKTFTQDDAGGDEMVTSHVAIDAVSLTNINFGKHNAGVAAQAGVDSWTEFMSNNGKYVQTRGGLIHGIIARPMKIDAAVCPTTPTMPNITIPSE